MLESLQILRRGLQRANGFSLFIAVCNSPAASREMIRLLQDAMPGTPVDIIELDESSDHPLDAVSRRAQEDGTGPVMILGLARANPSALQDHPALYALNLSRPEWPKRFSRSVVFWVPEYLLGLLEREAPDFMDWRSDTVFFPEMGEEDLLTLDSRVWGGGGDRTMPEPQRRARMEELRSRLAGQATSADPVILAARASWLSELGHHALLLGELAEAEKCFREGLALGERLERPSLTAPLYSSLGALLESEGRLDEAERMVRNGLEIEQRLGNEAGMAVDYGNLGILLIRKGRLAEARALLLEALEVHSRLGDPEGTARDSLNLASVDLELGDRESGERSLRQGLAMYERLGHRQGMATAYGNLAFLVMDRGDLEEAEELLHKGVELDRELGHLRGVARRYLGLGTVLSRRGDFARAEVTFRQALEISEQVGDRVSLAHSSASLGSALAERGKTSEAREAWTRARDLYREMGMTQWTERIDAWLAATPSS